MTIFKWLHVVGLIIAFANPAPAQELRKLKMMYSAVSGFAASYVVQEQGFFKKRGIDMEFIQSSSS
jgi:ABC-type nitrate/sulfonate/bicarbonate transport system substrate-binding protein